MSDKKETQEQVYESVDPRGVITELKIGGAFVHLLQDALIYVITNLPKEKNVAESYAKIEEALKEDNANILEPADRCIYTLTVLSQYLRDAAIAQGHVHKVTGISEKDLEGTMKAFLSDNVNKMQEEFTKLADKVKLSS